MSEYIMLVTWRLMGTKAHINLNTCTKNMHKLNLDPRTSSRIRVLVCGAAYKASFINFKPATT
jgi:hypothetical protein